MLDSGKQRVFAKEPKATVPLNMCSQLMHHSLAEAEIEKVHELSLRSTALITYSDTQTSLTCQN